MAKKAKPAGNKIVTKAVESKQARPRATRMSPDARKAQLLKCALSIYAKKGLGDANHTDLAEEASVAVPTTFHYFATKEDLTDAVLKEVGRFLIKDLVEPRFNEELSASQSIETLLMAFCDSIDTNPDYIRIWLEWSVAVRDGLWNSYLKFYNKALTGVKKILIRGKIDQSIANSVDVEDAARVIVGVAHMVAQMKFAKCSRETIEHTIKSLVNGYLEGYR